MNEDDIKTPGVGQCGICGATAHYMKWGQNVCADDENHVESKDEGWVNLCPSMETYKDKVTGKVMFTSDLHVGHTVKISPEGEQKFMSGMKKLIYESLPEAVAKAKAKAVPVLEKPLSKWGQAMREKLDGMKKSP